jgi:thiamine kinase-like enzyme
MDPPSPDIEALAGVSEADDKARLRAVFRAVPELSSVTRVAPLSGGITNRNYRVDTERGPFVVRVAGASSDDLGIDRAREHACSRAAEAAGVGAEVIAYVPEQSAIVTRFVEGRVLSPEDLADPAALRRVVIAVRRVHDGPSVPGRFSPFETVRDYHAKALARGVPMPEDLARALDRLGRIERSLDDGSSGSTCPCHNDLLPANFIDDGERVCIIDWEYGAMGDRFFDLGNLAVNNHLDEAGERAVLAIYFGEARALDHKRLRLMRLASDMRESLWGFLQAGASTLDFDFQGYARAHLDRFLRASLAEATKEG